MGLERQDSKWDEFISVNNLTPVTPVGVLEADIIFLKLLFIHVQFFRIVTVEIFGFINDLYVSLLLGKRRSFSKLSGVKGDLRIILKNIQEIIYDLTNCK